MTIYFLLYGLIIILSFVETNYDVIIIGKRKVNTRKFCFILIFSFLLLMGVLRGELFGVDSIGYKTLYFDYYRNKSFLQVLFSGTDFGYKMLNWLISRFTTSFWLFRAIVFTLCLSSFGTWIYKYSAYVSIGFLVFCSFSFISFFFCIMRQAAALSICIWAYPCIKERKPLKFSLIVLAAAAFHFSAIIMFIIYLLARITQGRLSMIKKIALIIAISLGTGIVLPYAISLYAGMLNDYSTRIVTGEGLKALFFYAVLFAIMGYYRNRSSTGEDCSEEYNTAFVVIYIQMTTLFFSTLGRIVVYSSIYMCIMMPAVIKNQEGSKRISLLVFAVMMLSVLYLNSILNGSSRTVPYVSVFD